MYWNILISALVYILETHGEEIVQDTKNPFDDVALQAVKQALKLVKF